jgi:hypothetical protein
VEAGRPLASLTSVWLPWIAESTDSERYRINRYDGVEQAIRSEAHWRSLCSGRLAYIIQDLHGHLFDGSVSTIVPYMCILRTDGT